MQAFKHFINENATFQTGGRIKTIDVSSDKHHQNHISLNFDGPNVTNKTSFSKKPLVTIMWHVSDITGKDKVDWVTWDIQDHDPSEFLSVLQSLANWIQKVSGQMRAKVLSDLLKGNTKKLLSKIGGKENRW